MRIGISTGGGDCPGLNAVIRAAVRHAVGNYNMEVFGIRDSFNGLMKRPVEAVPLKISDVKDILNRGGTILGTTNAGNPFTGNDGEKKAKQIMQGHQDLGFDAQLVIGGDGTQTIAAKFSEMGMNLVGVPKTIDNDQAATEISVGFQTAVDIATDAISRLRSTAESHDRIMVLELMGRDAGHIALHSGIAGGANVILLPEIPFDYQSIVSKIEERKKIGRWFSIVVVAEGAYEKGTEPTYTINKAAKYTNKNLGGIGTIVSEKLHELTGMDTRITVLGHVQRGGSPNPFDRVIGSTFGTYAIDCIAQKRFGNVVGIKNGQMTETPYTDIVNKTAPVKLDSMYVKAAEATGICLGRKSSYISR